MAQKTKKYICCGVQDNTMENLGIALNALTEVYGDECYYNYEIANLVHDLRMKIIPVIHEIHEETKCKE